MTINGQEVMPPVIDVVNAASVFHCAPQAFIVAMSPVDNERGELIVPDKTAKRKRLAIGTVIAAGEATGLQIGDHALVEPKYAKKVQGLNAGMFRFDGEVWMFGVTSPYVKTSHVVEARHCVYAVLGRQDIDDYDEPFEWRPVADHPTPPTDVGVRCVDMITKQRGRVTQEGRIMVQLLPKFDQHGGIVMPDRLHARPDVAVVTATSPACKFVRPGDWVIYQCRGIDGLYPEGDRETAYMPERAVFALCAPPADF